MKVKIYTLYLCLSIILVSNISSFCQAPVWQWAKSGAGTGDDRSADIAIDASGNTYVLGKYRSSSISFDSVTLYNLGTSGKATSFLAKYNANGDLIWVRNACGPTAYTDGEDMAVDAYGNIYISGNFDVPVQFDAITLSSNGLVDTYIAKYDSSGNFLWVKSAGGNSYDYSFGLDIDNFGNIYITGFFDISMNFDSTVLVNTGGNEDIFIAKYDTSGNFKWAICEGGAHTDMGKSITTDINGNIIITGSFTINISIGGIVLNGSGFTDLFIAKFDSSGNILWANCAGGLYEEEPNEIDIDSNGNIYVTGFFFSNYFSIGPYTFINLGGGLTTCCYCDAFLAKYDPLGNLLFALSQGDKFNSEYPQSVAVDAIGNAYITGYDDIGSFLTKYSSSGNWIWDTYIGGSDITIDGNGSGYLTGNFKNTEYFGGTILTAVGSSIDPFIAKFSPCYANGSINAVGCNSYISPSGKYTWTTSGIYIDTVLTSWTCDSILTINLIISTTNTYATITVNTCNNYVSPSGIYNWTISGTYYDTIQNVTGCDSIITINLIVNYNDSIVDSVTACNSFTWINGNTYTASTNSATFIQTNSSGCDSIIILNLIINKADTSVTQNGLSLIANTSGAVYSWLDCDNSYAVIPGQTAQTFTPTSDGNYALAIAANGCTDTSSCYNITGVGIPEINFGSNLNIYPNPTTGRVKIANSKIIDCIILTNPFGQFIFKSRPKSKNFEFEIKTDGIYFITITSAISTTIQKIIVQH